MTEIIEETPLVSYTLGGWNAYAVGSSIGRSVIDGEPREKVNNEAGNGVGHLLFITNLSVRYFFNLCGHRKKQRSPRINSPCRAPVMTDRKSHDNRQ